MQSGCISVCFGVILPFAYLDDRISFVVNTLDVAVYRRHCFRDNTYTHVWYKYYLVKQPKRHVSQPLSI